MRTIPDTMDAAIVASIDERLSGVATDHDVRILWAIESGSRAWGFPSPDSDYDCRFLYARPHDRYLTPWPARDVIETPLDKIYDVNGWDIVKAVQLLVKGNATVAEWLRSPIVYSGNIEFRDGMLELASSLYDPVRAGRHYLHVGLQQREGPIEKLSLKRVFYALRPAATLLWLRSNPSDGVPPMDLPSLIGQTDPGAEVRDTVAELIALKSTTREVGTGAVPAVINDFITHELAMAHELYESADPTVHPDAISRAEVWFRGVVERWG
ncbi:MAG: nucleotidyltransferase domain-containing protein [Actinobacteria bacterium]|nr:nucleotidyltransferase domain-containing protein [Actinomycetota bacterium]